MSEITITISVDDARTLLELLIRLCSEIKDEREEAALYSVFEKIRRALAQNSFTEGETPS